MNKGDEKQRRLAVATFLLRDPPADVRLSTVAYAWLEAVRVMTGVAPLGELLAIEQMIADGKSWMSVSWAIQSGRILTPEGKGN
jgi:hypothetical protein